MRTEVVEILARVLRIGAGSIDEHTSPDTVSSWDSLAHLELIAALEKEFGVRFNIREIQTMDSAARIEAVLSARIPARNS
ncbi:MAG: acyl carrier protein [Planctomycetota bacterium]